MSTTGKWGVQPQGFVRPSYDELLEVIQADLRRLFGTDVDLSSSSPLGQLAQVAARQSLLLWSDGESAYDAGYVRSAAATSLDSLAEIRQVSRNPATYATGTVTFVRSVSAPQTYRIPAGTIVASADRSITFATTAEGTIPAGASVSGSVPIRATLPGLAANLAAGTVTAITTPVLGVDGVSNPEPVTGGSNKESDAVFRSRIKSYRPGARGTVGALETALRAIDGVIGLNVIEDTSTNAISVYLIGGADAAVQTAIDATRPAGIAVRWARPVSTTVDVSATVTGGEDAVAEALIGYLNGLEIGADLSYNDLATAAMLAVPDGAVVMSLAASCNGQMVTGLGQVLTIPDGTQATAGTVTVDRS